MYNVKLTYRDCFGRIYDKAFTCESYDRQIGCTMFYGCCDGEEHDSIKVPDHCVCNMVIEPILEHEGVSKEDKRMRYKFKIICDDFETIITGVCARRCCGEEICTLFDCNDIVVTSTLIKHKDFGHSDKISILRKDVQEVEVIPMRDYMYVSLEWQCEKTLVAFKRMNTLMGIYNTGLSLNPEVFSYHHDSPKYIIVFTTRPLYGGSRISRMLQDNYIDYKYDQVKRRFEVGFDKEIIIELRFANLYKTDNLHSDYVLYDQSCSIDFMNEHKYHRRDEIVLSNYDILISRVKRILGMTIDTHSDVVDALDVLDDLAMNKYIVNSPSKTLIKASKYISEDFIRSLKKANEMPEYMKKAFNIPLGKQEENTMPVRSLPSIKNVTFNKPWTIVSWSDGTVTKCKTTKGTAFREEAGLAICFMKKSMGLTNTQFGKLVEEYKSDDSNSKKRKKEKTEKKQQMKEEKNE